MPILLQILQSVEDMVRAQALLQCKSWQKGPLLLQGGRVFNGWPSLSSYEEPECSHVERPWLERTSGLKYCWLGGRPTVLWLMTLLTTHSMAWSIWWKVWWAPAGHHWVMVWCSRPWWPDTDCIVHIYGQCVSFLFKCQSFHVCLRIFGSLFV